ncbi:MAG: elongation factor P [Arcobacter butzleri]|jgi:elongation factor P|nr:elongation factor P [Arcobacteraceae bacterium]MDY0365171.1 elongation factor P [Arcobacteraceae bacterium]NLO17413.1 elongation factor P [Aliarcobacter butzleri]
MAYSMSDLKKGLKIELEGVPYKIVEYQHVKPGKGAAFVRCKIKSYINGKVLEKTFHAGDKCEEPNLQQRTMQYLYNDGEFFQFMDNENYEQIGLTPDQVGDSADWIIDGMNCEVMFYNGKAITVEPPMVVELKIVDTPPNFKGDSQGGRKPATLESGAVIQIPFHVLEGEVIRVDTRTGEYIEKVK